MITKQTASGWAWILTEAAQYGDHALSNIVGESPDVALCMWGEDDLHQPSSPSARSCASNSSSGTGSPGTFLPASR